MRLLCLGRRVDGRARADGTPRARRVHCVGVSSPQRFLRLPALVHYPGGRGDQDGGVCRALFVGVETSPGSGEPSACVGRSCRSSGTVRYGSALPARYAVMGDGGSKLHLVAVNEHGVVTVASVAELNLVLLVCTSSRFSFSLIERSRREFCLQLFWL